MTLNKLAKQIHAASVNAGWWKVASYKAPYLVFAMKISLIHSEVSEMLEGLRTGQADNHLPHRQMEEVEAADVLIRLLDYAAARRFDLDGAVKEKLVYNLQRQDHKLESRAAKTGKKF